MKYEYEPIFLNEVKQEDEYVKVTDKIKNNPNVSLSEEEQMLIIYTPLFQSNNKDIENKAIFVVRLLKEMADGSLKTRLIGTVYVLTLKYLSENGQNEIWEVLKTMDVVRKQIDQEIATGVEVGIAKEIKARTRIRLVNAIKGEKSEEVIKFLIEDGEFTEEEIKTIYAEALDK